MAAGTSTPVEAGQGPGVLNIAATIGAKIRDAAQDAKEEREKAAEKGESPKKGSLFKSALANQFNPIKSKKQKSQWAKQFDWNKKTDAGQQVKAPPAGGGDAGKARLKEFIAGGFTAILKDTGVMVSKMDTMTALGSENLSETTKSSGTLTVIKETLDAQTELRRKALEEAKFARAEKKLEKREDVAGVNDPTPTEKKQEEGDGEGDGGGGGPLDWLLGGLDLLDTGLGIRALLGGGGGGAAAGAGGIGTGAAAGIVGGIGLAMSGLGEGIFQGTRFADQQNRSLKEKGQAMSDAGNPMGMLMGGLGNLGMVGNEFNKLQGAIFDVGGAPFRYAIEAAMHPFLNEEQKAGQAHNLAKFDARVREYTRGWMNRIDFMNVISDEKGGFGNIYGNDAAQKEMMGKMSEGGMIKLAPGGVVDDPMRTTLYPGDSVIPLNRNIGKQIFGDNATGDDPSRIGLDTSAALILGISQSLLGQTDSGTVGDVVQQKIRKSAKEFGISNLTFTSSLGKAQFSKVDPQKSAGDFMKSLFSGIKVFGGGGGGGGGRGGRNNRNNNNGTDPSIGPGMTATGGSKASQYITSGFGARNTGIPGASTDHGGIDVAGGPWVDGAAISVIKSGVVEETGDLGSKGWGRYVVIKHDDGTYSLYGHLSQINVKKGDKINDEGGDATVIGKVGSTGVSSGPHLHFELGKGWNGTILDKVDPAPYVDNYVRGGGKVTVTGDAPEIAQAPSPPSTPSSLPAATVTPLAVAQDGMVGKKKRSWWDFGGRFDDWINNSRENATLGGNKFGGDRYSQQMRELGYKSYQSGGARAAARESQRKGRIAAQSQSMKALNSGRGVDIKGGTFGTSIGKGYPAVYKGREAIKVKLPPGGTWEPEVTYGGKRWFGVKQGDNVIYVSNFKAGQKNLGVQTKETRPPRPAPTRNPAPASRPSPAASSAASATTTVVAPPVAPSTTSASAEGSFGDDIPGGKTSAMVFADFLYPDLV